MEEKSITISVGGRELIFKTGKVARQANGAVMAQSGETVILSTVCANFNKADADFLPLFVDYKEKFSSAGKTLGGFLKREGRPTEREILNCRLIDRPLRPLFPDGYFNETQVILSVLSYEEDHQPDPLAICAASASIVISDIPMSKPVGAVRVGMIDDTFIINPTKTEIEKSDLDLMIAGTSDAILMIEGYCDFLTEEQLLEAVDAGHDAIKTICTAFSEWQAVLGVEKRTDTIRPTSEALLSSVEKIMKEPLISALAVTEKLNREKALGTIDESVMEQLLIEDGEYTKLDIKRAIKKISSKYMRDMVLSTKKRCDGRACDEIRHIAIETDVLPRPHGSVLFTRGETQALAVCTLGGETMGQRFEDLDHDSTRRFYLQYSFPPFSVGEVGRNGPPGRREIGHGKLAERALQATIPSKDTFPYTIRLEANITESNGSSSMASICGGCLSMMAGGVPIHRPIAGIAMGLILEGESYAILSDILGVEDALGDMDFKIAGDEKGITAFQLDIKVEGINRHIMEAALAQAKHGRIHILKKMLSVLPESQKQLSKYAPKIASMQVKPSKIGIVIGPQGKQIREIVELTGVEINIDDDGTVSITSPDADAIEKAKEIIFNLTAEVEEGKTYTGEVVSIREFGAFVKIFNQEGLLHVSEIAEERVENVEDYLKVGQTVEVKIKEINDRGQVRLSMKDGKASKREPKKREAPSKPMQNTAPKTPNILPPPPVTLGKKD